MTFSAVPLIFQTTYGFNLEQSGGVFAAISIGSILFTGVAVYQESWVKAYLPAKHQAILETPEGRLYFACFESALLPIGCIWFGVTGAYPSIPWIVPALGVACATMGIFSIYLAVFNYLADSYHRYASSALAAQSFCRNMLAGAFPLFVSMAIALGKTYTANAFQQIHNSNVQRNDIPRRWRISRRTRIPPDNSPLGSPSLRTANPSTQQVGKRNHEYLKLKLRYIRA